MGHRSAVFLLLFLGTSLLRGGDVPDVSAINTLDNTRIIKAGDLLSVHIIKVSKGPEIITVGSNGEIKHLVLLKPLQAAGLTCRILALNLRRQLERDYPAGTQIVLVKFATSMDVLDDRHLIVPGDTVSIRVLEDRRDAEQCKVPENGMIEFRYVGAVSVEGMTCQKLAQFIRQKLAALPTPARPFIYSEAPTVLVALNRMTCGFPSMDELENNTRLRPGWTIGIRILEDKREKLQQTIASTGEVQVPYIGSVTAAGRTCAELAAKTKVELEKHFFRHATVLVTLDSVADPQKGWRTICILEAESVHVVGNIAKAGKYEMPTKADLSVSGLLAKAGGHTSKKQVPTIKILRKTPAGTKTILVDTHAALVRKSQEHDLPLRGGDVVLVE